eukprot:SAG31_NODE_14657_length_794_cov_0.962590_1_plen_100_part_10
MNQTVLQQAVAKARSLQRDGEIVVSGPITQAELLYRLGIGDIHIDFGAINDANQLQRCFANSAEARVAQLVAACGEDEDKASQAVAAAQRLIESSTPQSM